MPTRKNHLSFLSWLLALLFWGTGAAQVISSDHVDHTASCGHRQHSPSTCAHHHGPADSHRFEEESINPQVPAHSPSLDFVENRGQWPEAVAFAAEVPGGRVFIETGGFTWNFQSAEGLPDHHEAEVSALPVALKGHAFRAEFIGANTTEGTGSGLDPKSYHHNYFNSANPAEWVSGANVYGEVRLADVYPGIALRVYADDQTFKYDWEIEAGVDPGQIALRYDGLDGLSIVNGNLVLETSVNRLEEVAPLAYQVLNGVQIPVPCAYRLQGDRVSFVFPQGYNPELPLIIDPPTLIFGSYSGSVSDNWGYTATYDDQGALYGGGIAFGSNYPLTLGAYQSTWAGGIGSWPCDIAISKFSPDGSMLEYSTFLGGSGNDLPHSMICTSDGELWLYGTTGSSNFPVTPGCVDNTFGGGSAVTVTSVIAFPSGTDMFVSKLSTDGGSLLASTYLGGSANDGLNLGSSTGYNYGDHARGEIILDRNGNPIIASSTLSTNFPVTAGAFQTSGGGNQDGVIVKLNSDLSSLVYSTYIGGALVDAAYSMKLERLGGVVVCGGTTSPNFPVTAGAYQTSFQGGSTDGWVARLSIDGSTLLHSTYVGTSGYDQVFMVETDEDRKIYITGQSTGAFPVSGGVYSNPGSAQFLARMDPDLSLLEYSTVFGSGTNRVNIRPTAFLVDKCKNVYISGWGGLTNSSFNSQVLNTFGLPVTADASQSTTDGSDFYFIVFAREATHLLYATFFGGGISREHVDGGTSRFDRNGIIYQAVCAGCGGRDDFPTTPGVWSNLNNSSNCNLGVIKYEFDFEEIEAAATVFPDSIGCVNFPVQFTNLSQNAVSYFWDFGDGTTSTDFEPDHLYTSIGVYDIMLVAYDSTKCIPSDTAYLRVRALLPIDTTYDTRVICDGESVFLGGAFQTMPGVYSDTYLSRYGCDSVVLTTLSLRPVYEDTLYAYVCTGDSILFFGQWYSASGTYTEAFSTAGGCDSSFTLQLVVDTVVLANSVLSICDGDSVWLNGAWQSSAGVYTDTLLVSGGCDTIRIRTLQLIRFDILQEVDLCLGDSIWAGGSWQTTGGLYTDSLTSAAGCDSIVSTSVTLRLPFAVSDSLWMCPGDSSWLGGGWQQTSGVFVDTLSSQYGCDSVVQTTLHLYPVSFSYDTLRVCAGDTTLLITGPGGGSFVHTWTSAAGCDSLVQYEVIPLPTSFGSDSLTLCRGDSVLLDSWISLPGTYPYTLTAANGCDSLVSVSVVVLDTFIRVEHLSICDGDSVFVQGQWVSNTGYFADTLSGANGCDSILAWSVTVWPSFTLQLDYSVCEGDSVFAAGVWHTTSGSYTDSLLTVHGCDSVIYGQIIVHPVYRQFRNQTICYGDSVWMGGSWQSSPGIYLDSLLTGFGCDSIWQTTLSVLPESGSTIYRYLCPGDSTWFDGNWLGSTGVYQEQHLAANGCDSVITLNLQVEPVLLVDRVEHHCEGDSAFLGGSWQSSAGLYVDSFTAVLGCDSIVRTTLFLHDAYRDTTTISICTGDSVFLAGSWVSTPGYYTDFGSTVYGCDSIRTWQLRHDALFSEDRILEICEGNSIYLAGAWQNTPGLYTDSLWTSAGCDSLIRTTLVLRPSLDTVLTLSICYGDSVFLGGAWQTTSGVYVDNHTSVFGCDSNFTTLLTVLPVTASSQAISLCQGDSVWVGTNWIQSPGTYLVPYTASNGCDSVVQYNVSWLPAYVRNRSVTLCGSDSVFLAGQWVSAAGLYIDSLSTSLGCDSVIRYTVYLDSAVTLAQPVSICQGGAYFAAGAWQTTAGTYIDTLTTTDGCDSVVLTVLSVLPNVLQTNSASICAGDSVFAAGAWQTTSGFYVDVYPAASGCDSILILNLSVLPPKNLLRNRVICEGQSMFLAGAWQTTSGVYIDPYTAANGCDSNIVTTLTVLPPVSDTIAVALCPGQSIFIHGVPVSTPGVYSNTFTSATGCDSTVTYIVTNRSIAPVDIPLSACNGDSVWVGTTWTQTAGTYSVTYSTASGCDSLVHYVVSTDQSSLDTVAVVRCQGSAYFAGGAWQTLDGLYSDTYIGAAGCDSVIVTDLRFVSGYADTVYLNLCLGDSVFAGGQWQTTSGTYYDSLVTASGCDSIQVTITQHSAFIANPVVQILCEGDSVFLGGAWQSSGGLYVDTLSASGGCDSIVYTTLQISPRESYYVERALCEGDSAWLSGAWQTIAGLYVDTFANTLGCDSIMQTQLTFVPYYFTFDTLYLCDGDSIPGLLTGGSGVLRDGGLTFVDTLIAAGGCDSIVEYTVITHPPSFSYLELTLCSGDSMLIGSIWQNTPGLYTDTLLNDHGCDSIRTVQLSISDTIQVFLDVAICSGDSIPLGGGAWTGIAGTYVQSLAAASGCDSVVYTTLAVYPEYVDDRVISFCSGDSVLVLGEWRKIPVLLYDSLQTVQGCDSLIRYVLDTIPVVRNNIQLSICAGDSVFLAGNWQNSSGWYTDIATTVLGCDSLTITQLIVLPNAFTGINQTICSGDSLFAGGSWQSSSGIFRDTLIAASGCDSIVQITLNVLPNAGSTYTQHLCDGDSVFFNGIWLFHTGTYSVLYPASNGCDSTVTFHLYVDTPYVGSAHITLCSGDSVLIGGAWQSSPGTYVESGLTTGGCDSVLNWTVSVLPAWHTRDTLSICSGDSVFLAGAWQSLPGLYTTYGVGTNGCDSMVESQLIVLPLSSSVQYLEICSGDSAYLAGAWQTLSGIYTEQYSASNGCDSAAIWHLIVLPAAADTAVVSICSGNAYYAAGAWQTSAGLYVDNSVGPDGCPVQHYTDLRVQPTYAFTEYLEICSGDSVWLAGAWQQFPGVYIEHGTTVSGCDSTTTYTLVARPEYVMHDTLHRCSGDSVWLSGAWQIEEGVYTDSLRSISGCDSVILTNLVFHPVYEQTIAVTLCAGEYVVVASDTVYHSGTYVQSYTGAWGCDSVLRWVVDVLPLEDSLFQQTLCSGDSVFFNGAWLQESGVYSDTLLRSGACPLRVVLQLDVLSGLTLFAPDTLICEGDRIQLVATGAQHYLWSPPQGLSCTDCPDPWVEVSSSTLFTVTTTDPCFEIPEAHSLVEVAPRPNVDAGSDRVLAPGQPVTLTGEGTGNGPLLYWWEQDGQMLCMDCPEWSLVPNQGAEYTVWVEDGLGCRASDALRIDVDNSCVDGRFEAPNAFSPNADGYNDEFVIRYTGPATIDRIRIYNRWGEMLFETEDPEVHWNGVFRNKLLEPGVYVYYMEGLCEDEKHFLHVGNITLIR